jgi:ATP-binding cassette subfamily C protein
MGLISPDAGTIKVDGILLDQQSRQSWRKWVAYVPQEVFLLHGSIRDNLLWGNLEASDTQLIEALKRAHAQFVLQLPNGLDTMIGEGGSLLSGGERQRIVLARALLKNPTLLILDEATSALDPNNESSIQQALKTLSASLTVVIISHRLSILDQADQVITLREGALVSSLQKNFTRQ